jgi:poly-beta-1,6-N-acetyl-D-glucosamine synthase
MEQGRLSTDATNDCKPPAGGRRYVVVTPVRDEAEHVALTISSMRAQTRRPVHWVIVDDGSTDGTSEVLDRETAGLEQWITVVHRRDRGFRASGSGVMDAFYAGFDLLTEGSWDYLVKLDGDLSFEPDFFERCLDRFEAEPRLGIGGGTVCALTDGQAEVESRGDPPFHVRGATKIYSRACWQAVAPLPRVPGWDTLDEVMANRLGWSTRTFADLKILQHKPTGSADGRWRNAVKNGKANYLTGYHPAFMLAKCLRRAGRRPLGVEAGGLLFGYLSGYWQRQPKAADGDSVRYLRRQQLRRLMLRPSIYG